MNNKNPDPGILTLRLSMGVLMIFHGLAKLTGGIDSIKGMLVGIGFPSIFAYGVLIGEIVAPLAIIIGYKTRLAAVIYALNCLAAIFLVHSHDIFKMGAHGGWALELLGLYLFSAVALIWSGGGRYALSKTGFWD